MIPQDRLVLLDTNVLLHLLRGKAAGQWISAQYELHTRPERPLICVVTIGELLRIGSRATHPWGERRRRELRALLSQLVIIDISSDDVLTRYAEMGAYLDGMGRPIPQNDLWIGAAAAAKGAVLLTTDEHFTRLDPTQLSCEYIDPGLLP